MSIKFQDPVICDGIETQVISDPFEYEGEICVRVAYFLYPQKVSELSVIKTNPNTTESKCIHEFANAGAWKRCVKCGFLRIKND